MKSKKQTQARIKKLIKQRNRFADMKLKFLLDGMHSGVQYAEEDIREIEGEIQGLKWVMKKQTHKPKQKQNDNRGNHF